MIPSKTWFPTTLQERAAWSDNFAKQFEIRAIDLGFTAADVTAVNNDNAMLQFLANARPTIDAYADAIRTFRKVLTQGDIGDPTPAFPDDIDFTVPTAVPTGMFERIDFLVRRIRVSTAFTEEVGAILDINPKSPEAGDISKPVITATPQPGNVVRVAFVKGRSDGIKAEIAIDKGSFADAGRFLRSPAEIEVPQNEDELPRSVQVRARFLLGNHATGEWSDIATVQTIP